MIPQTDIEMLHVELRWELSRLRSNRRGTGGVLLVGVALITLFILWQGADPAVASHGLSLFCVLVWAAMIVICLWYDTDRRCRKRLRHLVRVLVLCKTVSAVPDLVSALTHGDRESSREAAAALTQLLPRVRVADTHNWNSQCVAALYRTLRGYDPELILAVLGFLEECGEPQARTHVLHLMQRAGWPADTRQTRNAARKCIESLRRRATDRAEVITLLRASKRPVREQNVLVRPVSGRAVTYNQLLLRVSILDARTGD